MSEKYFTKKTIFEGSYNDVEAIAREYGLTDYEMLPSEECSNCKSATVRPEFDEIEWGRAVMTGFMYKFHLILNRACFDGKIEAGEYYIDCSW